MGDKYESYDEKEEQGYELDHPFKYGKCKDLTILRLV